MIRKENVSKILALIGSKLGILGLFVASLSCVAAWIAVIPIFQDITKTTAQTKTERIAFVTVTPTIKENPFQIYDVWYQSGDLPAYWRMDDIRAAQEVFSGTTNIQLYEDYFPNAVPATIAGNFNLSFDVENVTDFSQINLTQLLFEVERNPLSEIQEIYMHPPGLGGGTIRDFQAVARYDDQSDLNVPNRQSIIAKPSEEEDFDFITLSPGERETINVDVDLTAPGLYHIVPLIKFSFREDHFEYKLDPYDILVPEKYRIWAVKDRQLNASSVIVNNETDEIEIEEQIVNSAIPSILFESSMVNGVSSRIFLLDGTELISPIDEERWMHEILGGWGAHWSNTGEQIIYNSQSEDGSKPYTFDLLTGERSYAGQSSPQVEEVVLPEIRKKVKDRYGDNFEIVSVSPDGKFLAAIVKNQQKDDFGQIIIVDTTNAEISEINEPSAWCNQPTWSPSGQKLAFICKPNDSESELWSAFVGADVRLISTRNGKYLDPAWSEDEKKILVGGDELVIFESDSNQSSLLLRTALGYFYNPSWQPQQE